MAANTRTTRSGKQLPLLSLRGLLVFPNMVMSFEVGRERSIRALEAAMLQKSNHIILAAQREAIQDNPDPDEIYHTGTVAQIKQLMTLPDNRVRVLVKGLYRVHVEEFTQVDPYYNVIAKKLSEGKADGLEVVALMRAVVQEVETYLQLTRKSSDVFNAISSLSDPSLLADSVAAQLDISVEEKQSLLEIPSLADRLERIYAILVRECEILEVEKRIKMRVRKQIDKAQREYYLREQMKAIQKELGESDDKTAEIQELHRKITTARLPKEAREKAEHELQRLERMPPMAPESVVVRGYLDWMVNLPWSKKTKDRLDLQLAEQILNRDHYGLDDVKERILEFLAVRHLAPKMRGPIMCLVGPPGVGKTSLAKSVAEALDRKFYRFSLGGLRDEAEIRGHRRTYIGAMPGKVIQAMRSVGSRNPVILLDEIDKMGSDFRGDPASALLEVLDPEQNSYFKDNYIEIGFNLSDVMFITTANQLYAIPRPLRDRMEVIHIPGYTQEEKLAIGIRHLLPKQMEIHGLKPDQLRISERVMQSIISGYTREAGVRSLERTLAGICRKAARDIVAGEKEQVNVTKRVVQRYLGQPHFRHTEAEKLDQVGVATGLAYTEVGGDILHFEVTVNKGHGKLTLTGKLGDVMRESAQAAFSYVRSRASELGVEANFTDELDVHIHVPEGAVPKDGPSAGITIAVALASAISGRPSAGEWAMTGEITLRGLVLPVGGIKEKVLAAYRAGHRSLIIPRENEKDLEDIPPAIRKKLRIELVGHMDEVIKLVLLPPLVDDGQQLVVDAELDEEKPAIPTSWDTDNNSQVPIAN